MKDSFEQNSTWAAMRSPLPQTHRPGFRVYTRQTHGTKETLFEGTFKIEPKILFCFLFTSRAADIWETLEKCFPEHQKRNIDKEIKWKSVCVLFKGGVISCRCKALVEERSSLWRSCEMFTQAICVHRHSVPLNVWWALQGFLISEDRENLNKLFISKQGWKCSVLNPYCIVPVFIVRMNIHYVIC